MPLPVTVGPSAQVLWAGEPFVANYSPEATISATDAKDGAFMIPHPSASPRLGYPILQVSTFFSAGVTKTAEIILHARDMDTLKWHALALVGALDAAAVTTSDGQVLQFEFMAGRDRLAIEISALGDATARPHITVRPAAWISIPVSL
jgi:hypothetical protein